MIIMVCGPYRAANKYEVYRNIQAAREVAEEIWRRGHYAFCPHLNSAFMDGLVDDKAFLELGLLMTKKVDAVCLMAGWGLSKGATAERIQAMKLGKRVFYSVADVPVVPW
jgi:hypothetical protein